MDFLKRNKQEQIMKELNAMNPQIKWSDIDWPNVRLAFIVPILTLLFGLAIGMSGCDVATACL